MVNCKRVERIYREEKLMVRRCGSRKRAFGERRPVTAPKRPTSAGTSTSWPIRRPTGTGSGSWRSAKTAPAEWLALLADTSISGQRVARELEAIIAWRGTPAGVLSDKGTELTSSAILD